MRWSWVVSANCRTIWPRAWPRATRGLWPGVTFLDSGWKASRVRKYMSDKKAPDILSTAPIRATFDGCKQGYVRGEKYNCCPPNPRKPTVDFKPVFNSSRPLRIRRALQCLDEVELSIYRQKLEKAYELMRALPPDDPRSFHQQDVVHCAYGSGFLDNGGEDGLDVHFGWLFHPWHRWFLYFHERILQSLLDDSTFTLHFWNWDNDGAPAAGRRGCFKAGNTFPAIYADPSSPLFHPNRSLRATITPSLIVDLGIDPTIASDFTQLNILPESVVMAKNSRVLRESMVTSSASSVFFGRSYRAGDERVKRAAEGIGSLELMGHATVHFWVGGDMFRTPLAAKDPVFYGHHGNVERLWHVWHRLGPGREDPDDPDFLDAEFLFFDEKANLNRVTVRDCLDTRALGYYYEETNDASWNYVVDKTKPEDLLVGRSESVIASILVHN